MLPSSGPLSMTQVAAELGISAIGLSLGDPRVRALAGVGPSGAFSMSSLYGKSSNNVITGLVISLSADAIKPSSATATMVFNSDGSITGSGKTGSPRWYGPNAVPGIGAGFWVGLDHSIPPSSMSTAVSRSFSRSGSSVGTSSGSGTIQIYNDPNGFNPVAVGTYTFSCTVENNV